MDIPEYKPITHFCPCCGHEIEDEEDVYEVEPFVYYCEACFLPWAIQNTFVEDFAKMLDVPIRKACET